MPFTVFFSWQSDSNVEQDLIERALNDALERIADDATVEAAVRQEGFAVDRDTKGIGGTPPIVDTIFAKIDGAAIFVPDLTFVSNRISGRPAPNPNVLIEYGWALKALGHRRMVPVMNTHYGRPTPEAMPFDMRHLKFPIQFDLPPGADASMVQRVGEELSHKLEENLRVIIQSPGFGGPATPEKPFPAQNALFRFRNRPIGKTYGGLGMGPPHDIRLQDAPSYWMYLRPLRDTGKRWSTAELKQLATTPNFGLLPPASFRSSLGLNYLRGEDGFAIYAPMGGVPDAPTNTLVYVFETGEVWSIDAYHAEASQAIYLPVDEYVAALDLFRSFLKDRLGIDPPYQLGIGVDRIKDKKVWLPHRQGRMYLENPTGSCIQNEVSHTAVLPASTHSRTALRPFFQKLLEKCGVESPELIQGLFPTMNNVAS